MPIGVGTSCSIKKKRQIRGDLSWLSPEGSRGMGAELLEAGDDYSIHTGQDGNLEYYSKVLDDSLRFITVILRYDPSHAEAVEPLKELVRNYHP